MSDLTAIYVEQLGREIHIRPGTSDVQGWKDVFECGYHVPPDEMPVPHSVLDLGANIGLTAAHYAAMWPEAIVWMAEPNPDNMALARKNAPMCPPLLCAVTRHSGRHWLREEGLSADAYTLTEIGEEHHGCRSVYSIGMATLVDILGAGEGIDFVKMDIEGAEWEIFDPGWGPPQFEGVRYLLVEFHAEPRDGPKIVARGIKALEAIGYEAHHHKVHPQAVFATQL